MTLQSDEVALIANNEQFSTSSLRLCSSRVALFIKTQSLGSQRAARIKAGYIVADSSRRLPTAHISSANPGFRAGVVTNILSGVALSPRQSGSIARLNPFKSILPAA
jgi:hypothetical protein